MTKTSQSSKSLLFAALIITALFFISCHQVHAQTNVSTEAALSNAMVVFEQVQKEMAALKTQLTPTNAPVVYYDKAGNPIATNTPAASLKVTPENITGWISSAVAIISSIGGLLAAIVILARSMRKLIPDKAQVNGFGLALSNLSGEINPSIAKLSQAATDKLKPPTPPIT